MSSWPGASIAYFRDNVLQNVVRPPHRHSRALLPVPIAHIRDNVLQNVVQQRLEARTPRVRSRNDLSDFLRLNFAEDVALECARRAEELLLGKIKGKSRVKAMSDQFDRADEVRHLKHPAVFLCHLLLSDDRARATLGDPLKDVRDALLPAIVKDVKCRGFAE